MTMLCLDSAIAASANKFWIAVKRNDNTHYSAFSEDKNMERAMPMLIEYIDVIARKKQRGVLSIDFHPGNWGDYEDNSWRDYDFEKDTRRTEVIARLDEHDIGWQMCGPVASEYGWRSYIGEIYIDVPFDEEDPVYQLVRDYLEKPDGTMRDERVRFMYLPLEHAMENAHHDEPGFWEKWAETF